MIELRNSVNEAKIKLGLSNSELSKLIGHSRNYISEALRIGASTEKQLEITGKIKEAVAVEQLKQAKNMIYSDLAIANRDKNFMKKKLQDKNLLINWLVASNVFFILFLVAKCVGWV